MKIKKIESFIKNNEVSKIEKSEFENLKENKKLEKAVTQLGKNLCDDLGLSLYLKIILLVNEDIPYYESCETTGCLAFIFYYNNQYYKYHDQW